MGSQPSPQPRRPWQPPGCSPELRTACPGLVARDPGARMRHMPPRAQSGWWQLGWGSLGVRESPRGQQGPPTSAAERERNLAP